MLCRRFYLEYRTPFEVLKARLKEFFQVKSDFSVSYKDNDGDQIPLTTDNEVVEMFAVSRRHSICPVHITVTP